jgi:hypothetical protein
MVGHHHQILDRTRKNSWNVEGMLNIAVFMIQLFRSPGYRQTLRIVAARRPPGALFSSKLRTQNSGAFPERLFWHDDRGGFVIDRACHDIPSYCATPGSLVAPQGKYVF